MTPAQRTIVAEYLAGLPTRIIADNRELYDALKLAGVRPNRHATTDAQRQAANLKRSRAGHLHNCRVALNQIRDAMAELEARVAAQGEQR